MVFERPPPGVRKIVISTNIAETSVTIDDVVYVVDSGRVKENRYDPINKMASLVEVWASRASCKQRRGRAGRVRPGVAFHLYSSEKEATLEDYTTPEMLRVPLEETALAIKACQLGDVAEFLRSAVNPPEEEAVQASLQTLRDLRALDASRGDRLTALGYHLAQLPVDPRLGKMLLLGATFRCLDPVLTVAAVLGSRSPFVSPLDKRDEADDAKKQFHLEGSDHLTSLQAFLAWRSAARRYGSGYERDWCRTNYLSRQSLSTIADMRD